MTKARTAGGFGFKAAMRYDCYLNGERIRYFFNREQAESFARCDKNIKIEEHPQIVYE